MYVGETKRQGFVNESRAAFWRLNEKHKGKSLMKILFNLMYLKLILRMLKMTL